MSKAAKPRNPYVQAANVNQRLRTNHPRSLQQTARPVAAYRQRKSNGGYSLPFTAAETWHEPRGTGGPVRFVVEPPGEGYVHPVTVEEVRARLALLPARFTRLLEVVQFSRMTKKRALFPCYGMQWGSAVYLYPIETSYQEVYGRPPTPQQKIDARAYGGEWLQDGSWWVLSWTKDTIRDFYLNNVLIHEIGHVNDDRNVRFQDRERYADWFAIEYGYRASRGRC